MQQPHLTSLLAQGTWRVDPSATEAAFTVSNFLLNRVTGTIAVRSGDLVVDADGRPLSAEAVLDAGSIDTGNAKRDADLRSSRFLDVQRQATICYTAAQITGDQLGWRVDGQLTVGRRTTALALEVRQDEGATGRHDQLTVTARGVLDRAAVGIRAPAFMIGRQVDLTITTTLHLAEPGRDRGTPGT